MQTTITNIIRTSPPYMVRLTKPVLRPLPPGWICKDARRCNNAIRGRHALIREDPNPACGPVGKRRPRRTTFLLLPLNDGESTWRYWGALRGYQDARVLADLPAFGTTILSRAVARSGAFRSGSILHDLRRRSPCASVWSVSRCGGHDDVLRSRSSAAVGLHVAGSCTDR